MSAYRRSRIAKQTWAFDKFVDQIHYSRRTVRCFFGKHVAQDLAGVQAPPVRLWVLCPRSE